MARERKKPKLKDDARIADALEKLVNIRRGLDLGARVADVLRRRELETFARVPNESVADAPPTNDSKRVPKSTAQDAAILAEIRRLDHDPLALPKPPAGKGGVKAKIRTMLLVSRKDIFQSRRIFNDAWQRLRDDRQIADRTA